MWESHVGVPVVFVWGGGVCGTSERDPEFHEIWFLPLGPRDLPDLQRAFWLHARGRNSGHVRWTHLFRVRGDVYVLGCITELGKLLNDMGRLADDRNVKSWGCQKHFGSNIVCREHHAWHVVRLNITYITQVRFPSKWYAYPDSTMASLQGGLSISISL